MYKIDPTLSTNKLISHIQTKYKITITNTKTAKSYLTFINYNRLIDYFNKLSHTNPGICFEEVIKYYDFDRKLKLLAMDGIERIEIAFRALILNELVLSTKDEIWYCNKNHYHNQIVFEKSISIFSKYISEQKDCFLINYLKNRYATFNIQIWTEIANLFLTLTRRLENSSKNKEKSIKVTHHFLIAHLSSKSVKYLQNEINLLPQNYSHMLESLNNIFINNSTDILLTEIVPYILYTLKVPFYLIVEALTMGQLSRLYPRLKSSFRQKIANQFKKGLDSKYVTQHLIGISQMRNIIAHHDRLFNVTKLIKINNFDNQTGLDKQNAEVYCKLILYYLDLIAPSNTFQKKLDTLINRYTSIYNINVNHWGF